MTSLVCYGKRLAACIALVFSLTSCLVLTAPLPQVDGTLTAPGLTAPVEVLRDAKGVPNLYAQNSHDLFFAQGYVQAQDRWWQMEFYRHVARGAIGELVGAGGNTMSTDSYLRALGIWQAAERDAGLLSGDVKAMFDAFTDGVNAYISSRPPTSLAFDYTVLLLNKVLPVVKPWTNTDSIAFSKLEAFTLAEPFLQKIDYDTIVAQYGLDMFTFFAPPYPFDLKPTILQAEDLSIFSGSKVSLVPKFPFGNERVPEAPLLGSDQSRAFSPIAFPNGNLGTSVEKSLVTGPSPLAPLFARGGSNNWIINGSLSQSGKPLFANDPHLGIAMPSVVYQIGLHSSGADGDPPINVVGMSFAPAPGMIFGHNDRIAWGVTAGEGVDVWDEFRITVNPADPTQYQWNGQWTPFTLRTETFNFGDGAPAVTLTIRETVHGPVMNDLFTTGQYNNTDPRAVRWAGLTEPSNIGTAILGILRANNFDDYRAALGNFDSPPLHFGYADVDGNIGYQFAARVPIRAQDFSGIGSAPGDTDVYLWNSYIPFDDLPRMYNPARGYIVTANNELAPQAYFDNLTATLGGNVNVDYQYSPFYGYRAQRILEMLAATPAHTVDSFKTIQTDLFSINADEIVPYIAAAPITDPNLAVVRDWLATWDRQFTVDSPQALLYALFYNHIFDDIYLDQYPARAGLGMRGEYALRLLMENPTNAWWDNINTPNVVETRDVIIAQALGEAYNEAVSRFGSDRTQWQLGAWHHAKYTSLPLGASGIAPIEFIVNRGPYPAPGSMDTIDAASWTTDADGLNLDAAPSMRMIYDLANWDNTVGIICSGQSGHPASSNYDDQIQQWLTGKYHRVPFSHDAVQAAATHTLTLQP